MIRKYNGYEIIDNEIVSKSQFVVCGQMDDGTLCYHKLVDGIEDENCWYSRARINGYTLFILEAIN